jgi:hypothetical protein
MFGWFRKKKVNVQTGTGDYKTVKVREVSYAPTRLQHRDDQPVYFDSSPSALSMLTNPTYSSPTYYRDDSSIVSAPAPDTSCSAPPSDSGSQNSYDSSSSCSPDTSSSTSFDSGSQ